MTYFCIVAEAFVTVDTKPIIEALDISLHTGESFILGELVSDGVTNGI